MQTNGSSDHQSPQLIQTSIESPRQLLEALRRVENQAKQTAKQAKAKQIKVYGIFPSTTNKY